jgi:predicted MFS family arabinose efflux permease
LSRYAELLRAPGVLRLEVFSIGGRVPQGMLALAFVLLMRDTGHSYAEAGVVAATHAIALAATAPVLGRLVDRLGPRAVMLPLGVLFPLALALFTVAAGRGAAIGVLVSFSALAGALLPPLGASMRALWPRLVPAPELRQAAYGLEASLQEIIFVCGPRLAALIGGASPAAAVLAAAGLAGIGTLGFALTPSPPLAPAEASERAPTRAGALAAPGVRIILLVALGMGASFGIIEVAAPAFAEEHGALRSAGGIALAAFSLGSLLGGLWAGSRGDGRAASSRLAVALVAYAAAMFVPGAVAGSLAVLSALLAVAGFNIAPAFAAAYGLLDALALPGTATEAFAWISTSVVAGVAVGAAAGGAVVEGAGSSSALLVAAGCAATGAAIAAGGRGLLAAQSAA